MYLICCSRIAHSPYLSFSFIFIRITFSAWQNGGSALHEHSILTSLSSAGIFHALFFLPRAFVWLTGDCIFYDSHLFDYYNAIFAAHISILHRSAPAECGLY